jgi:hypothetical protein
MGGGGDSVGHRRHRASGEWMDMERITLGDLIDVRAASVVAIRDSWSGMSPHAPIRVIYDLRPTKRGALSGTVRLSTHMVDEVTVPMALRSSTATRFLDALGAAAVVPGKYQPTMEHTDDFPHIEIDLHAPSGQAANRAIVAKLYTESQGEFHAPWGARIGGKVYTLPGDDAGRALGGLERLSHRRRFERVMREAEDIMDLAEHALDDVTPVGAGAGPVAPDGPGKELAKLLDEMSLHPIRKPYGMWGKIDVWFHDVTPDMLTVTVRTSKDDVDPARLALNVRNAVVSLLGDMVPCPKFRAVCSVSAQGIVDQEHVLDFFPAAQHRGETASQVILIEEHAEPHRAQYRPRVEALWNRIVAAATH